MWVVLALGLAAHAGSYGGATVEFPGFRAMIDASVGAWSDPTEETRAFEAGMEAARRRLAESEALLVAAYAAYATGDHRYQRLRTHLADRAEGRPTVWTNLYLPEEWGGRETVMFELTLQAALSGPLEEKLLADFALAQIGATLPPAPSRAADPTAVKGLESQLGANLILGVGGKELHGLLLTARLAEPELRALAARSEPLALDEGLSDYAAPGWVAARVLVAVLDGKPVHDALGDVSTLPEEPRGHLIRLAGLALSDADLDRGTRALTSKAGALSTSRDGPLADWLAAIR